MAGKAKVHLLALLGASLWQTGPVLLHSRTEPGADLAARPKLSAVCLGSSYWPLLIGMVLSKKEVK